VKAYLPRIIRYLLVALISCSAAAQERHTAPRQERKLENAVVVAQTQLLELTAARLSSGVPGPSGQQPSEPAHERTTGFEPIPLWRGQGKLMPIPPAEGPPEIILVRTVRHLRSH